MPGLAGGFGVPFFALCLLGATDSTERENTEEHRAAWMAGGTYGVMVHYLLSPQGDSPEKRAAEFNRIIDGFDLDAFMETFTASRADWLIFTIGQNTGYWNSSNEVIDRLLPGRTPRRDLVLEIARRIEGLDKHFIVYLPVEVSAQQPEVQQAFGWNPEDQTAYLERYQQFVRAYSRKLGRLHHGWWFDGWYDQITRGKWKAKDWIDAARAGNLDAIVAFNDGAFCVGREKPVSPLQDYHAGEVHLLWDGKIVFDFVPSAEHISFATDGGMLIRGQEPVLYMPTERFIGGVQWHALVPIDSTFNPAVPDTYTHYSDADLLRFIRDCRKVGGAVTLNVPIDQQGHIPETTAAQLTRLGKAIE
jgi:hypothetical protein